MSQDSLEQRSSIEPRQIPYMENTPDLVTIVAEAGDVGVATVESIRKDIQGAQNFADTLGDSTVSVVAENMQRLQDEAKEESAAFDALAERLDQPYVISDELSKVVEVARFLEKPLLLEGEPGTGKTSLAYALAGDEDLSIIHAQCKSTVTAQELLYKFDVLQRLQDAQMGKDVSDLRKYVRLGPLGQAFASQEQVILLIDEVDKAKREFTNDLLEELDQMGFFIPETGEHVAATQRPIVIITSNNERDLPEPVRRRCVYHHIDFPGAEQMTAIVKSHIPDVEEKLIESAIKRFYQIRDTAGLQKKPSTSEIVDWIRVLQKFGIEEIENSVPFPETLLKHKEDLDKIISPKKKDGEKDLEERLKAEKMPEAVIAALRGNRVVRLKNRGEYYESEPETELYTLLANEGYSFTTAEEGRPFTINSEKVQRVDNLTFVLYNPEQAQEGEPYLYDLFKQEGQIASEFVVSDEPVKFTSIEESNKLYIKGTVKDGRTVYKIHGKNGKVVYEKPFEAEYKEQ